MALKYCHEDFLPDCGSRAAAKMLVRLLLWEDNAKVRFDRDGVDWLCLTQIQLSESMGVSDRAVRRSIKVLRDLGLIEVEFGSHPMLAGKHHSSFIRVRRTKVAALEDVSNRPKCPVIPGRNGRLHLYRTVENCNQGGEVVGREEIKKGDRGSGAYRSSVKMKGTVEDDNQPDCIGSDFEKPTGLTYQNVESVYRAACAEIGRPPHPFTDAERDKAKSAVKKLKQAAGGDEDLALCAIRTYVTEFDNFVSWNRNNGRLKKAKSMHPKVWWLMTMAKWILEYHEHRTEDDREEDDGMMDQDEGLAMLKALGNE
ncbi:MAG TPA: hypothetical protein DD437_12395 [Rhodobiaceae bacterium]|nr:hypothetical protein [Rhodobiaceae bacterium]